MKYKIPFLILTFAWSYSFSQNCYFSYEEQEIVNQAKKSVNIANSQASYANYVDLVTKCSKALDSVPDCEEIYYFYNELITTYHTLAKGRGSSELYFYEQAIKFSNRYLQRLTDPIQRDTYTRFIKTLKEEYSNREQVITKTIRRERDEEAWGFVLRSPTKKSYKEYLDAFSDGDHTEEAKESIKNIDAKELWEKLKSSDDIDLLEDYLNKYPKSINDKEAKQKLSNLYFQNGNIEFDKTNYQKALNSYNKASKYFPSNDIQAKINSTEELIMYEKIKDQNNIADCETYLKQYPKGKFIEEVTAILCSHYYQKANSLYKSDRNKAKEYYNLVSNFNCPTKEIAESSIKKIDRKNKTQQWNNGFKAKTYFSYIFEINNLSGYSSNYSHGFSIFDLNNKKWGFYTTIRASVPFFAPKKKLEDYPLDKYFVENQYKKSISSVSLSMGTTKKIFRPIFIYFGLGFGINSIVDKYSVIDLYDNTEKTVNIKNPIGYNISPEAGLIFDLLGASLLAGIKYPIAVNKISGQSHKGIVWTFGIGFGINKRINK